MDGVMEVMEDGAEDTGIDGIIGAEHLALVYST